MYSVAAAANVNVYQRSVSSHELRHLHQRKAAMMCDRRTVSNVRQQKEL